MMNASAADLVVSGVVGDSSSNATATSGEQFIPDPEEEEVFQKSMEFVFEVVLLSTIGALGIAGNTAALVLFSRQSKQLKFHRLMMMLAAYDLFYIVLSLLLFTIPQISPGYKTMGYHYHVLPRALPLAQMTLTGSIYSTLAMTVERYLTVCHPFYTVSHKWSAKRSEQ